jgi:multiple sugar transport system permease protein
MPGQFSKTKALTKKDLKMLAAKEKALSHKTTQKIGSQSKRKERWFYLFLLPWIIGFLVFQLFPILSVGALSFSRFNVISGLSWNDFENFKTLVRDPLITKTMLNTLYYTIFSVPLGLILAFCLALLLNSKIRGIVIFRTIFFLPAVVHGVAVILLWGWIFNPKFGLINGILKVIGITGPAWLQSPQWALPSLIIMSLWGVGWMMLVYLAGLQDIPAELYEAAEIDGASSFQRLRYITLPMISSVTFFLMITSIIGSMQIFLPTYVLTRGGPNNSTMTISLLIFFSAFLWDKMGLAATLALVLFIIIMGITLIQFAVAKRWVFYNTEVDQ